MKSPLTMRKSNWQRQSSAYSSSRMRVKSTTLRKCMCVWSIGIGWECANYSMIRKKDSISRRRWTSTTRTSTISRHKQSWWTYRTICASKPSRRSPPILSLTWIIGSLFWYFATIKCASFSSLTRRRERMMKMAKSRRRRKAPRLRIAV